MTKFDYIIVGGGIIGMATARELALQGACVALIDKGKLGQEASWAAGGILSSMRPWTENPVSAELSECGKSLYPTFVQSLIYETGIDPEYVKSGLVIIEQNHITDINKWARSKCMVVEEGIVSPDAEITLPEEAILLPEISQIRPNRLLKALSQSIKKHSVSVYENSPVSDLVVKNNRFEYIELEGGKLAADAVIITAGAWTKEILGSNANTLDIKPVHGQMLCLKPTKCVLNSILLDGGHYFIPRLDGNLLIGSTMEDTGFNKVTTINAREELLKWAYSIWPNLESAELIKHWSGLRPASGTERPFIGLLSGYKNIYLNTGHFRKGILQAPSSAKLLVDMLSGRPSFMNIQSLSSQRGSVELA